MRQRNPLYSPVLNRKGTAWFIEYYIELKPGQRKRVRRRKDSNGVDLNSIVDLAEREVVARRMIAEMSRKVKPADSAPSERTFVQALAEAVDLKHSEKWRTNKSFSENARWMTEFFESKGWGGLRCSMLEMSHVQAYFDHLLLKKKRVANSTYNSRRNNLRALFSELVDREYIPENFIKKIKPRPKTDPIRRPLSEQEVQILVRHIREDRALWLAYLLLGWLAIRPGEMRDLRVGQVDLKRGVVTFPGSQSKNRRNSVVTIPAGLLPEFEAFELDKYPARHYLFGAGKGKHNTHLQPGAAQIGVNSLSHKFRTLVRDLHKRGVLQDITGLQLYSLKDTLAIYLIDHGVHVESAMLHFRHSSLEMFQRYVKRLGVVNENIKQLPVELPGKK